MYFIGVCTELKLEKGWPEMGSSRTVGYMESQEDAFHAVETNACDIFEFTYKYAIIENIPAGLYPYSPERWFFEWNDKKKCYEPIEEPEGYKMFNGLLGVG